MKVTVNIPQIVQKCNPQSIKQITKQEEVRGRFCFNTIGCNTQQIDSDITFLNEYIVNCFCDLHIGFLNVVVEMFLRNVGS